MSHTPERSAAHMEAAAEVGAEVTGRGLRQVRLSFADQHGLLRGKVIDAALVDTALEQGIGITGSLLTKDTGQAYAFDLWSGSGGPTLKSLAGARDVVMVPDPTTFRVLPWADGTGWMQCDLFDVEGQPIELSTRRICQRSLQRLRDQGYELRAGLEIEFHLYHPADAPMDTPVHQGWDLLAEQHSDQIEPLLAPICHDLELLGLSPRSVEAELGPGQIEMTFAPAAGMEVADHAVLLRSAIKQLARRHGLRATFMSRPQPTNSFPSGWHLHQSLAGLDGTNLFTPASGDRGLSDLGQHYLAGLLEHASESCLLTTPTVTGYKRYRPNSVAPDRIAWSQQHRGAMLRVIDQPAGPSTRIENRAGDTAANPYLYMTSQVLSGLDGIRAAASPPGVSDSPYQPDAGGLLPRHLGEALDVFAESEFYRGELGDEIVDYLVSLKRSEWSRFLAHVTDWERTEYLDLF